MPRPLDLELFLKQSKIFRHLGNAEVKRIAAASQAARFDRGQTIFEEGAPSDALWLVKEGRVHLMHYQDTGRAQSSCVMTPGESFCCLSSMDQKTYPATAVAATASVVVKVPLRIFHEYLQRSPELLRETLCVFSERLRQVEAKGCLVHDPVERRVAQALLTLEKKFGGTIPLTRQEVAELADTTVETVIRTMARFQKQGWVKSTRGKIHMVHPEKLSQLFT